jgi:hypothetical protein
MTLDLSKELQKLIDPRQKSLRQAHAGTPQAPEALV